MATVDLLELRKQCITSMYLAVENAGKYLIQNKDKELKILEECTKVYCELDTEEKVINEALQTAKREVDSSNADLLQSKFQAHLNRLSKNTANASKHPYMIEFKNRIARIPTSTAALDESDLAVTESVETFIDPITKKTITEPVRNKECGHIYEKSTILQLIRGNKRQRCPVAGCGNKNPITASNLEEDEALTFRVALSQNTSCNATQMSVLDLDNSF